MKEDNYYVQDRIDDFTINCFELLTDENSIKSIIPLNNYSIIYSEKKITFSVGDNKLIGFDLGRGNLFLGDYERFKHYIGNIKMSDKFMSIEIPHYIETHDELLLKNKSKI
jgi:hypothetical protein